MYYGTTVLLLLVIVSILGYDPKSESLHTLLLINSCFWGWVVGLEAGKAIKKLKEKEDNDNNSKT